MIFDKFLGEIAEVGVAGGCTAKVLGKLFPEKTIHLFDTFTGIPDILCEYDYITTNHHRAGDYSDVNLEKVKKQLLEVSGNFIFHVGIFPETAESVKNKRFCLVNIDVDIYQSTKDCWEFFYPRMIPGGVIIIFDDYPALLGVKKATDNFLKDKPEILQEEVDAVYMVKQ